MSSARSRAQRTLVLDRVFEAPRDLVFEVWTKPEHLTKWWGPNDFSLPFCEIDFRPGGSYRFCMRSPDGEDHWVWGRFEEIVRPEKIVMTWNREDHAGHLWSSTIVTVTFGKLGKKTAFNLHQALFETAEYRDKHNGGWSQCLERLGEYVIMLDSQQEKL